MTSPKPDGNRMIPRVVSLMVLLAVVLLVTAIFFRVMLQFIAPLFLAAVLVVVFEPIHLRVMKRFPGRTRLASLITTGLVVFVVLAPTAWLAANSFSELQKIYTRFDSTEERQELLAEIKQNTSGAVDWLEKTTHRDLDDMAAGLLAQVGQYLGAEEALAATLAVIGFLAGLAIMTISMYYFFADGPAMVKALMQLSPLDDEYEKQLLEKFAEVSRAVVVATLASAVAQGLLAGVGYWFVLPKDSPIFLLTAVTMLCAIIPFVGAAAIWVPVAAWVFFMQGDTWAGVAFAVWGFAVVSMIDNLIKPLILHGQSNLHPLLALLSVLGGVSVMGPVGILVGPMVVAFLQALLDMLRKELEDLRAEPDAAAAAAG